MLTINIKIELERQNTELKQQIIDLIEANPHLMDELQYLQTRKVTTYVDGKFTDDLRICVNLLAINVGIRQIEPVIRAVMRMCKVNYDRLP